MQNNKFKRALAEALINEYEMSIPQMEEHIFSQKFERKMKKLINRRKKPYYMLINTAWKRAVCAVMAIIVSTTIVMQVEAVRNLFKDFFAYIYERFSILQSADNGKVPETIEDIYAITYDLSEYKIEFEKYTDSICNVIYRKDETVINIYQTVKSEYDVLWNTENSEIETIIINGKETVYFKDNHNYETIIWDNGDYIISINSNIGKDALIEIVNSMQKVE